VPEDWWKKEADRPMPPPSSVREELKPEGDGWVVEVRGSTYWQPEPTSQTQQFIIDTLLRNIISRSRALPEPKTDAEKEAAAHEMIRGKISHAFVYNVWKDENPSPDTFQYIRTSLIDPLVPSADGSSSGGGGGFGMGGMAPVVKGGGAGGAPPIPGGPGFGASANGNGWTPLVSGGSAPNGGGLFGGPGGPGGPVAGPGGPGAPPGPMIPAGMGPGRLPGDNPGGTPPPKGIKMKPRFEFVIVFTWKEPTPSDKLRQIKKKEASQAAGPSGPGKGGGGVPAAPPAPMGMGGGGGVGAKGGLDDLP
jgi:hypothetical protein